LRYRSENAKNQTQTTNDDKLKFTATSVNVGDISLTITLNLAQKLPKVFYMSYNSKCTVAATSFYFLVYISDSHDTARFANNEFYE